ncbi:MAG: SprT family zinc-dependent metalloprotease [Clostridiaceae bacterium]|nr:SprT family zinc-dependent metalloprotease [Clostridiaceae bacterium]
MIEYINKKHNYDLISKRRSELSDMLILESPNIKSHTIKTISDMDLKLIFELYDRLFFGSWFKEKCKCRFKFSLSRRMTKSAGLTICPKNVDRIKPEELVIEIRIGVDFFFQYGLIEGSKTVCGIRTENSLQALLLVFEHEICHVIEFILYKHSKCSGTRFKSIANNIFGRAESYHKLPTHRQIASQKFGINIGDAVNFTFDGRNMSGIIYSINKRATVMVKDKNGILSDRYGNRYSKYYVPLSMLN